MVRDGQQIPIRSGGQYWLVSWHRPPDPPAGIRHGAEGVCVTRADEVVLVSRRGDAWQLPGGRPEPGETWEDTLRREMLEKACAMVVSARLLGFTRGACIAGPERGRVLVRSGVAGRRRGRVVGATLRDPVPPGRRGHRRLADGRAAPLRADHPAGIERGWAARRRVAGSDRVAMPAVSRPAAPFADPLAAQRPRGSRLVACVSERAQTGMTGHVVTF